LNAFPGQSSKSQNPHNSDTDSEHNPALSNACEKPSPSPQDNSIATSEQVQDNVSHPNHAIFMHSKRYNDLPDFQLVVETWEELPEAIRTGIVAMVKAAKRT